MITKAMPLLLNSEGKHLEFRNAADEIVPPVMELKSGEDARAAAKRAVEEFFGFNAPEDAIKEGFQARVGNEVVAVYPIDAQKMEMSLLRPAESVATWAWRDVPPSMGDVVALGFPRNLGERRNAADAGVARTNGLVNVITKPVTAGDFVAPVPHASKPMAESSAQYALLRDSVAAKAAALHKAPEHERAARAEELAQETEDLRLLAADMGISAGAERRNTASEDGPYTTARALIRQNDGTILAARQKDGRSLLPGGHLENGETADAAVARELQEELGLDIKAAMTGEGYDFHGEDGSKHRVFVVDGGKLDLSKMVPGDDVGEVEVVNSPFTDSHGAVHPQQSQTPAQEADIQELERHAQGIAHELGELERKNAAGEEKRKKVMEEFARGALKDPQGKVVTDQKQALAIAYAESGEKQNASDTAVYAELEKVKSEIAKLKASGQDASRLAKLETTKTGLEGMLKDGTKKNDAEAGNHGHQYPDRLNGAFPVLICASTAEETVATQETADGWRCEACGAVIDGPPKPELVVEGA